MEDAVVAVVLDLVVVDDVEVNMLTKVAVVLDLVVEVLDF
jgi:hypothetical protein